MTAKALVLLMKEYGSLILLQKTFYPKKSYHKNRGAEFEEVIPG